MTAYRNPKNSRAVVFTLLSLSLAACAVGPDYRRPNIDLPAHYTADAGWKTATPRDSEVRGNWWEVYGDAELDALEQQVRVSNQTVAQAEAGYRQARALAQGARAAFFPVISAVATSNRSSNKGVSTINGVTTTNSTVANTHSLALDASWEPDLWGKVRRQVEAGTAAEAASAADLVNAALSAQGELAQDYFQLRVTDAEIDLYSKSIVAYQRALTITRNQFAAGMVTRADVASAETQLQSTQVAGLALEQQRATLQNAIAVLVGKAPGQLSIAPAPLTAALPGVPETGVPSDLLERRPDIAAAERNVAAANADIGVARAAYYPALSLTSSVGREGSGLGQWLQSPPTVWSLGASLAATLFQGGAQVAATSAAQAAYDGTVAQYKQTVLSALQEVEDDLGTLRVLEQEAQQQTAATAAAEQAATLYLNQYKAGTVSYLNVVTAQATALANERNGMQILGQQFSTHVLLIEALGGAPVVHRDTAGSGN